MLIGFLVHSLASDDVCLFAHFFDHSLRASSSHQPPTTTGNNVLSVTMKEKVSTVIQRVNKDHSRVLSTAQERSNLVDEEALRNTKLQQGAFMIHDKIAHKEGSWLILYQLIPKTDIILTMICSVRNCNRVLASHILSQISLQLVASVNRSEEDGITNPPVQTGTSVSAQERQAMQMKQFLLRPELVYACLHRYCPHGQLLLS